MKGNNKFLLTFAIFLLVFGFILNFISANYISIKYDTCNMDRNPDLILSRLSARHPNFMYFAEVLIVICIAAFVKINYKDKRLLVDSLIIFAVFVALRGIMTPLTVLGGLEPVGFLSDYKTFSFGLFPSGHTAIPACCFLMTKKRRFWFLALFLVIISCILISQQHYTIDVISSFIFVYAIKSFYEKHVK